MAAIISKPGVEEKLRILSTDSQYDLACACGTGTDDRRHRGGDGKWIYPITLPNGGKSVLFKTLVSNICENDCAYCPLRDGGAGRKCALKPEETAKVFLDYLKQRKVFGLFLSSGVTTSPDATMDRLNTTARILRQKYAFRGFIHLKIIPGASQAAIEDAVSLASAVSLNIETPGEKNMRKLSSRKRYLDDIIEPMKLISNLTAKGNKYSRVKQTTQFIVGPAGESDAEIVKYTAALYDRLNLSRIYFSAYQKPNLETAEKTSDSQDANTTFVREHRLYQTDFLFRRYGFSESDIIFDENGRLSLTTDPKQLYADAHPEKFPININNAPKLDLLKVPGLGPITVNRILKIRRKSNIHRIEDFCKPTKTSQKAQSYLSF